MTRTRLASTVTLAALLAGAPVAAATAPTPRPGHYRGTTSQVLSGAAKTVSLRTVRAAVHRRATAIADVRLGWLANCKDGRTFGSDLVMQSGYEVEIVRDRFEVADSYRTDVSSGMSADITYVMRGRFVAGDRASGTFAVRANIKDQAGKLIDTCSSGTVTWSASRR